jgi:hypothetical protein
MEKTTPFPTSKTSKNSTFLGIRVLKAITAILINQGNCYMARLT